MGVPWYLNPLWEWDLHDKLDELELSSGSSKAADQRQDQEIQSLKKRVTELEGQLLALEKLLSEHGILPPMPAEPAAPPTDTPARFPARTREIIPCPRCGKRQQGNRDLCYSCKLPFVYDDESSAL